MIKTNYYSLEITEITKKLKTNYKTGLNSFDIQIFQKKYGKNIFQKKKDWGLVGKILAQFRSPLIFVLLAAGITTVALQEYTDAIVIFIALGINTIIGTFQENKASQAFDELSKSQQKYATVIRDGNKSLVSTKELVIGDIVILDAGMSVPADIRLFEEKNILINESALTGEWVGVPKTAKKVEFKKDLPLRKKTNIVWMGTLISSGYGKGIVVEIGDNTEIGKIAKSLGNIKEEKTPLKENVEKIARLLSWAVAASLVVIFSLGILRGEPLLEMILVAVAVAVAAIPEGLPAAVTSVLALGMRNILKKGGLVRNLLAAETLGSTTVILTDKTGTLTEAKMKLSEIITAESIGIKNAKLDTGDNKELLKLAVISSDAFVEEGGEFNDLIVRGRPLEKAIVMAGLEKGLSKSELIKTNKKLDFLPFESERGFSISLNNNNNSNKNILLLSGKPELLLAKSKYIYKNGKEIKLTDELLKKFEKVQKHKSSEGLRFTAIAYKKIIQKTIPKLNEDNIEKLVFVGFLIFNDPIRLDVGEAIKTAKDAGAKVIMVTGDNPNTARKIAEEAGIIKKGGEVLIGDEIEKMKDGELLKELKTVKVFARIIPAQKLRISKILQNDGEVVAMTGDGINDAPALQGADIGITVENGTEVAKEASDMILLNSDFSVIISAIREGRRIVDNLKKIVGYLLSTSFSEVFLIAGSLLAGFPLPVLPGQILWANIIEEGLMNFAFVFEPGEKGLMKRNPRDSRTKTVLTKELKQMITIISLVTGFFLMALYWLLLNFNLDIKEIRTIMFVTISLDSVFFTLSLKSFNKPIWKEDLLSNKYLIFSLFVSILLLLVALFFDPIKNMLSLVSLSHSELVFLVVVGLFNLFVIEITKYFVFIRKKK